ncbi:MAG: hypothetical protein C0415_06400 [Thermodesulfovibrio sp.]|nr:hypothetical protein [Thermodesulfovibrio sp.]
MSRDVHVLLLCVLLLIVSSCLKAGNQIDSEMVRQNIKMGQSTKEDVLRVCGEPSVKYTGAQNDVEIWRYSHVDKKITPAGVLTNILGIGTEWKSESTVVEVYFKGNFVVDLKIETSQSQKLNYGQ